MTEKFLQYIWQFKLYNNTDLFVNDKPVEIISNGTINTDSGPDFFNAKIKIADTLWVGNVEIHINSSDWFKHNHHKDKAYDNVILHVVKNKDAETYNSKNIQIPTIELKYPEFIEKNYKELEYSPYKIACETKLQNIESFYIKNIFYALAIERLNQKNEQINNILKENNNNWENAFYILLFRHFGAKVNADSFEMLAKNTELKILAKHKNNLTQIEAILFGQAGFLDEDIDNEYHKLLKQEYKLIKSKFNISGLDKHQWKFLRLRPANFPTVKIALAAKLIYQSSSLFSKILQAKNIDELYKLFNVSLSSFWETHYTFEKESIKRTKHLGKASINTIIINVIIPFLFNYGQQRKIQDLQDRAISFLEQIKAENNSIIRYWNKIGVSADNAFQTQALLQLYNNYCLKKKCLSCKIGYKIMIN